MSLDKHKVPRKGKTGRFNLTYNTDPLTYIYTAEDPHPLIMQDNPFVIDIENNSELSYTGPVYVGSSPTEGTVIYDTGSGTLTIASTSCNNCQARIYNPAASTTAIPVSTTLSTLKYGSATL